MSDKLLSDWLVRDPGSNTPLLNPQYGQVLLTTSPVRRVSCQVQSGRKYWSDLVDRIYSDSVLGEDSSPSVLSILWWCALTAPAGWTRIQSETSVVGRRRVMIRAKYCFEDNMKVMWKCQLWQMYPKTRMRRKSLYQPYIMMGLTISPNMKKIFPSCTGKEQLRLLEQ